MSQHGEQDVLGLLLHRDLLSPSCTLPLHQEVLHVDITLLKLFWHFPAIYTLCHNRIAFIFFLMLLQLFCIFDCECFPCILRLLSELDFFLSTDRSGWALSTCVIFASVTTRPDWDSCLCSTACSEMVSRHLPPVLLIILVTSSYITWAGDGGLLSTCFAKVQFVSRFLETVCCKTPDPLKFNYFDHFGNSNAFHTILT